MKSKRSAASPGYTSFLEPAPRGSHSSAKAESKIADVNSDNLDSNADSSDGEDSAEIGPNEKAKRVGADPSTPENNKQLLGILGKF